MSYTSTRSPADRDIPQCDFRQQVQLASQAPIDAPMTSGRFDPFDQNCGNVENKGIVGAAAIRAAAT